MRELEELFRVHKESLELAKSAFLRSIRAHFTVNEVIWIGEHYTDLMMSFIPMKNKYDSEEEYTLLKHIKSETNLSTIYQQFMFK